MRAAYYTTASRPRLQNLTQRRSVSLDLRPQFGDSGTQPVLFVTEGNPDLDPAYSHNFSVDLEWYGNDISVYKMSFFYKKIEDSLQTTRTQGGQELLPEDLVLPEFDEFQNLPDNILVDVSKPINSDDDDKLWGVELSVDAQLSFLPPLFEGLGVYANYTYADSEKATLVRVSTSVDESGEVKITTPFNGSPKHQGTFGFTYSNHGFDSTLLYTYQDRRLSAFRGNGLSEFSEDYDTLDFQLSYLAEVSGRELRFLLRGEDLLRGERDTLLRTSIGGDRGIPTYYTGATYLGGRTLSIGVSMNF